MWGKRAVNCEDGEKPPVGCGKENEITVEERSQLRGNRKAICDEGDKPTVRKERGQLLGRREANGGMEGSHMWRRREDDRAIKRSHVRGRREAICG